MSLDAAALIGRINEVRRQHAAPPVVWDETLARAAQDWANRKTFAHSPDCTYGENVAKTWTLEPDAASAIRMWAAEMELYDPNKPGYSPRTGHGTQIIWKGTTRVGAAVAKMDNGAFIYVAKFSPPGNLNDVNAFRQNVSK